MSIESISQNNYVLATQQEVTHDGSLSGNGTVESPLGVVPGYNETVLWSGTATSGDYTLSESYKNFEKIGITYGCKYTPLSGRTMACDNIIDVETFSTYGAATLISTDMLRTQLTQTTGTDTIYTTYTVCSAVSDTKLNFPPSLVVFGNYPYNSNGNIQGMWKREDSRAFYKIVGINRIANN